MDFYQQRVWYNHLMDYKYLNMLRRYLIGVMYCP
jgi:hypothetical protein